MSESHSDFSIVNTFMRAVAFVFASESQMVTDKVRGVAIEEIP